MKLGIAIVLAACGGTSGSDGPRGTGATSHVTVGPGGGVAMLEGATLTIPQNALTADVEITIESVTAAPVGYPKWYSPIYRFGPAGTTFAMPATLAIAYTGSPDAPVLAWSSNDGGPYTNLAGSAAGGTLSASIGHFSEGLVISADPSAPDAGSAPSDAISTHHDALEPTDAFGVPPDVGTVPFDAVTVSPDASAPIDAIIVAPPDAGSAPADVFTLPADSSLPPVDAPIAPDVGVPVDGPIDGAPIDAPRDAFPVSPDASVPDAPSCTPGPNACFAPPTHACQEQEVCDGTLYQIYCDCDMQLCTCKMGSTVTSTVTGMCSDLDMGKHPLRDLCGYPSF